MLVYIKSRAPDNFIAAELSFFQMLANGNLALQVTIVKLVAGFVYLTA
jgi:hypothetical protein